MNIRQKLAIGIAAVLLLCPVSAQAAGKEEQEAGKVSILFSHDMHSHLDEETITRDGKSRSRGGFARLYTAAETIKRTYPDSLLLDAGDFSMGTPYQTVFSQEAAELRMMGSIGYDATVLGNHEFDYRAAGLAKMLRAAKASGDSVPSLLCANIDWERTLADPDKRENGYKLKVACRQYGVQEYRILEKGDARIAVFGILGKEAEEFAPESGLYFKDPIEAAEKTVEQIQKEEPDLIVCLSHSGTYEEPEESEDELLAQAVPEIDVIISGHTHTELNEPIKVGKTVIASCGSYTDNLGHILLQRQKDGSYALAHYRLIPLDDRIKGNPQVEKQLKQYRKLADEQYFSKYGYEMNTVLAYNKKAFTPIEEFAAVQREEPLGNLIADSYRYAVRQAEGADSRPVDVALVPAGVVRASFGEGEVTAAHAFNVNSLGYGKDGTPGYPLVTAYLTGRELKAVAEVDGTVSDIMQVARISASGLKYDYNKRRLPLNRVTDVYLDRGNGNYEKPEPDQLYRTAADLYSCQMLGAVKGQSFGLLSIEPKDEHGNPIENFEDHIVYDNGKELKAWYALASYLDSFDGGMVPERYEKGQQRKTEVKSAAPAELFKQPNKVAVLAAGAVGAAALGITGICLRVRRRRRKAKDPLD